jgi:hypothetical protein
MFCKEKLSLIIRIVNNSAGKFDWLFKFLATNPLSFVVQPVVIFSLVLISIGLVEYCSDFYAYGHYSCHYWLWCT